MGMVCPRTQRDLEPGKRLIITGNTGIFTNANNMSGDWLYTVVGIDSLEGTFTL